MYSKSKFFSLFIILLSVSFIVVGCKKKTGDEKSVISIKGSDTMVNLAQKWAEDFMNSNENVSIQVTGGGSGTGITALIDGTTNIAVSSRELKESELTKAKNKNVTPKVYEVALDGIAVIVNPENGVEELTLSQVSDIFTGKIKNWKEVGGKDLPITLYGRENSSGTYEFFREHVLGKNAQGKANDYASSTQVLQGTASLGEAVAKDVKGIGYGGVGYFAHRKDVKILKIKKDEAAAAIAPAADGKVNYDVIWDGSYSISRYLFLMTNGEPAGEVKNFIDFIISDKGQDLVRQMEYIPLPKK